MLYLHPIVPPTASVYPDANDNTFLAQRDQGCVAIVSFLLADPRVIATLRGHVEWSDEGRPRYVYQRHRHRSTLV
jgi:hypothetical protein